MEVFSHATIYGCVANIVPAAQSLQVEKKGMVIKMIFPPNLGLNLFDSAKESKKKIALIETKDDILHEVIVDVLSDARILTYTRVDTIMKHKKIQDTLYRIYVSDTMCRKAKAVLDRCGLHCDEIKMLN